METTTLALIFLAASQSFGLPKGLVSAVCWVESTHRPHVINYDDGHGNSNGVCQVKHKTAKWMGFKGTEKQLMDPKINAYYAAKYLSYQIKRYKNTDKAISAYNAGSYSTKNTGYVKKVKQAWKENR